MSTPLNEGEVLTGFVRIAKRDGVEYRHSFAHPNGESTRLSGDIVSAIGLSTSVASSLNRSQLTSQSNNVKTSKRSQLRIHT